MRRLYLQVYLTIVASLVLVVLTAGVLWHFLADIPAFDQTFEVLGEVVANLVPPAAVPPEQLQHAITELSERFGTDLALFDASGERLAFAGRPVPAPGRTDHPGSWQSGPNGRAFSMRLPDGRWLVARIPFRHHGRGFAIVAFLGAIAIAVALGALPVARRLTGRLERLQRGVDMLGAGDLRARVEVEGRDEVAALANSFNQAAARIENLVEAHKMLLANASHELRTPLARIRLGIELAKGDAPRTAELKQDIAELDQLIDEILLASRLDANQRLDVREPVDVLALAAEESARYDDCGIEGQPAIVLGDPTLLRRMIRNLIENARRHGKPPIELGVRSVDGRAELSVSDHGATIPEAGRERLFSPFYRSPGASGSSGTGLGLALVRQIARRHSGDVAYAAGNGHGNRFTVTIPISNAN